MRLESQFERVILSLDALDLYQQLQLRENGPKLGTLARLRSSYIQRFLPNVGRDEAVLIISVHERHIIALLSEALSDQQHEKDGIPYDDHREKQFAIKPPEEDKVRNAENEVGPNEEFVRVPGFLHLSHVLVEEQEGGEDVRPQVDDLRDEHGDERGELLVFETLWRGV